MTWRPKKEKSQPSNSKQPIFWATCNRCGNKLAIPHSWVEKYLARVMPGYEPED